MDINFKCPHCAQELTADDAAAGTEIACPSCAGAIVVPAAEAHVHSRVVNPIAQSAAAKEEKHFSVPVHDTPSEMLITKPLPSLDVTAHEGIHLRVKTIRRSDCVEVGKDHFDEVVTKFLEKIGEPNVVTVSTFNYTHQDLASRAWITDFGILVLYRG